MGLPRLACPECYGELVFSTNMKCCGRAVTWLWATGRVIPAQPIARMRRGKYVVIPAEWRGQTVDRQTKRKRRREPRELTIQEQRLMCDEDHRSNA